MEVTTETIAGFYTLSAGSVTPDEFPEVLARKLPRYSSIPIVRIGRLAVDVRFQKKRLGGTLVFDALRKAANSEIAIFAAVVDALDENAVAFYRHMGFERLQTQPLTLFLPISHAIKKLGSD